MLRINVTTAEAVVSETELITAGRKGLKCAFTFSDDWSGLQKIAVFQGVVTRDIALLATNETVVPAECIAKANFPLKIGVYGALPDGTIAIPTIWVNFGKVQPGAHPSLVSPDEVTPDVVAQIEEAASNALYLARNVQSMADSGALDGVSPAVTVTSIPGGHNIKITDRDHPSGQDFDVLDGTNGTDGSDGVSPEVTIGSITGGHSVTITDADHPTGQTFNVMDGQDATVDATLSNSGEAADAAKTGEVKHTAEYALQFAETLNSGTGIPVDTVWQLGGFASDGTNENSRTYRARMKSRMSFPADVTFKAASGYQIQYVLWDSEGTWKSSGSWITSKTVSAGDLVRIGVRAYPEDTSITADPDVFGAAITIQNNIHAGMPTGGTTGQVLKKKSGTDYDTEWANESGGGGSSVEPYTSNPAALGTASPGSSDKYARGDHVHAKPTYSKSDVGLGNVDNVQQYSANNPPPYPVSSVNGQTGAVTLSIPSTAADVGALPGYVVTYTITGEHSATCDKTYSDILSAIQAKKNIVCAISMSGVVGAEVTAIFLNGAGDIFYSLISGAGTISYITHYTSGTIYFGEWQSIPAPSSPSSGDVLTYSGSAWAASAPHYVPAGGNAGAVLSKNTSADYSYAWRTILDYTAAGIVTTAAGTAAKVATYAFWDDTHYPQILYITLASANTSASALTMKVNGKGPYPIYINGTASSNTNYTLPAGSYLVYFDGTNFYFDTTGKIPSAALPVYNGGVS